MAAKQGMLRLTASRRPTGPTEIPAKVVDVRIESLVDAQAMGDVLLRNGYDITVKAVTD